MIIAFDLDDTLYSEIEYVRSGFRAVAEWLAEQHGADADAVFARMIRSLDEDGRGHQFDVALREIDRWSKREVLRLRSLYRTHRPKIELPEASRRVLEELRAHSLYLVTDGNATAQQAKVDALGVAPYFRHCYLTNRYGPDGAKPSTKIFRLMLARERAKAEELVYVGDNPVKDFVGIRSLGGRTIRVLTGGHSQVEAEPGYDADMSVSSIAEVPTALSMMFDRSDDSLVSALEH